MATIALPPDLEDWARAEVTAGRGASVADVVAKALRGYRLGIETFRQSLDDAVAEADRDGWIAGEDFMRELDQWICDLAIEADGKAANEAAE